MSELRSFFETNDIRIGEGKDFATNPPVYYSSLTNAFYYYFKTFRDKDFSLMFDSSFWTRKSLAFNLKGEEDNIVFSILGFHRFFELLLKDVLRRLNPYLAVRLPEKESDIFLFYDKTLPAEAIRTIEYSDTVKRFKQAYKYYSKESTQYVEVLQRYEFVNEQTNMEFLTTLSEWRNRIMHNGSALPNILAFDYLISQGLVPIISKLFEAEKNILKNYEPPYLKTRTGVSLLDQMLNVKFSHKDFSQEDKNEIALKLIHLGHIKEMGRAVFYLEEASWYHEAVDENFTIRSQRIARQESLNNPFASRLIVCCCCGEMTLLVFKREVESFFHDKRIVSWCKCFNCDYSLNQSTFDPNDFGLSSYKIFDSDYKAS